jgi:hypothetical protein
MGRCLGLRKKLHRWIKAFHPDDPGTSMDAWQNLLQVAMSTLLECRLRSKRTVLFFWWLVRGVPVFTR